MSRSCSGRSRTRSRSCSSRAASTCRPAEQNELATKLLVGAVIWAYLGIIFEIVTETVAWERWEGTIEYTFMAPVSRPVHLIGMGVYAVLYGLVRAAALRRRRRVHRHPPAARELRGGGRVARDRIGLVHRRRDDDRGTAPDLAGEGDAARLRRPGTDARRLRRLLPGRGAAGAGCSGSRRSRRRPTRCAAAVTRSCSGGSALGRRLAAARDRRRSRSRSAAGLPRAASATRSKHGKLKRSG